MLKAIELTKTYKSGNDEFWALDGVSVGHSEGDCLAIVGKSGSGKSTLMHFSRVWIRLRAAKFI